MYDEVDDLMAEYLQLTDEVKRKNERIGDIKSWCLDQGSFATDFYVCSIVPRTRTGLVGLDKAVEALGRELLESKKLIAVSEFKLVYISQKLKVII